ncbi:toll/interleukin-1 receptor domain-containing protein [Cryptosporangium phraense]|nr:toll/interleukin-1 receptor domain-containing protein [Cryptosporangium phraense]
MSLDWEVALSYAGAQREYVERVATELGRLGVRCFFDRHQLAEIWGENLSDELVRIYGSQAAVVIVFGSAEYVQSSHTIAELTAASRGEFQAPRPRVLAARFDDTPVPGISDDQAWIDLRGIAPEQFAEEISRKLDHLNLGTIPADLGWWRTRWMSASIHLDTESPRIIEHRSILAESDEMKYMMLSVSTPVESSDGIDIDTLYGGSVIRKTTESPTRTSVVLKLTRLIRIGESHALGLMYSMPSWRGFAPQFLFSPLKECDVFRLRVQFRTNQLPIEIREIRGVAHREIRNRLSEAPAVEVDRFGGIALDFSDLQRGLAYGAVWGSAAE